MSEPIELTVFTKDGGPLTKQISLAADGTLIQDKSACVMCRGAAERVTVGGTDGLGALIETLTESQALALGGLRADLPDKVAITTKKMLLNGTVRPDLIARIAANIVYRGPAFALIDFDTKGMPATVASEMQRHGGFWPALLTVLPVLEGVARLTRSSTSAGLSRSDTGAVIAGSDGVHVYPVVKDGADIERFLRALHDRCWLAGLGWIVVSRSGALLNRSIVDRMVGQAARLVFEGGPVLKPPLQQDKASRRPVSIAGVVLDTLAACPPLTIVEQSRLDELKARERERLAPEKAKAQAAFVERQAKKLVARKGISEAAARQVILRQCEGVLRPDVELPFDDPELAGCTVGDVLADPERFEGETLADPLEGVEYGPCKARIMRRADGTPWIHSFAHGRTIYELKYDAAAVRKAMEKAAKDEVVATFARLAAGADLDAVELAELRQLAKKLSGVGLRAINAMLKAAQQQQAAQHAKAARAHHAALRQDPRPQIRAPFPDDPWLPQMEVLNEVIGAVVADMPPARDIDDDATRVRKIPVPNMHAFTDANEREPEETTNDQTAAARAMGAFENERNGSRRDDRAAHRLLHRGRGRQSPLGASADAVRAAFHEAGRWRAADRGCDRDGADRAGRRRVAGADGPRPPARHPVHHPGRAARGHPDSARTARRSAVKAAMEFLCDEWLVDVATDYAGKCTIIAAALTLIERSLLPDRPCFFVTAGRRGGGKTTTLTMLIMAVTGLWPAAAAWSTNEEERRKALMSLLPLRRALHPVGQHRARHADLVPAHREVLHRRVLFRPQARRQRNGLHRRFDHPPFHRQQYRAEGRPGLAQPAYPPRRRPRRPREPAVQAPGPDRLDREPPRRDPGGALHHPAGQSPAQGGARRRGQDPI